MAANEKETVLITIEKNLLRLGKKKAETNFQKFSQYLSKLIAEDSKVKK